MGREGPQALQRFGGQVCVSGPWSVSALLSCAGPQALLSDLQSWVAQL